MYVCTGNKPVAILSGRYWPENVLMVLPLLLCWGAASVWAQPMMGDEAESSHIWNFDTEKAETLPQNFIVGMLVDGRPAGEWKVIDMKKFPSFLQGLDRRERARIIRFCQLNGMKPKWSRFAELWRPTSCTHDVLPNLECLST
jgi:hypothetical protein